MPNNQKSKQKKATDTKPGQLMHGVIYPVGLSAGILSLILLLIIAPKFWEAVLSIDFFLALWLLIYFGSVYLIFDNEPIKRDYGMGAFVFDIGDVILIVVAFNALGLFDLNVGEKNYDTYFWALLFIPVLATIGKFFSGRKHYIVLSVVFAMFSLLMAFFFSGFESFGRVISVLSLYFLVVWYFIMPVVNSE